MCVLHILSDHLIIAVWVRVCVVCVCVCTYRDIDRERTLIGAGEGLEILESDCGGSDRAGRLAVFAAVRLGVTCVMSYVFQCHCH